MIAGTGLHNSGGVGPARSVRRCCCCGALALLCSAHPVSEWGCGAWGVGACGHAGMGHAGMGRAGTCKRGMGPRVTGKSSKKTHCHALALAAAALSPLHSGHETHLHAGVPDDHLLRRLHGPCDSKGRCNKRQSLSMAAAGLCPPTPLLVLVGAMDTHAPSGHGIQQQGARQ